MVTVYIKRDDLSCWVGKGNNMPVRVLKWSPVPVALTKHLNVEEGARAPCAGHCDSPAASGSPARREPGPAVCVVCEPGAGGTELATSLLLWGQCYRCGVCHWDRQGGGGGEPTRGWAGLSEAAWEWAWRAGFPQKFRNALPGLLDAKLSRRVSGGLSQGVGWCPAARGVGEEIRCDLEKQG